MAGEKWTVRWNNYMSEAYIYGSEVEFTNPEMIVIHNELIPSGTVLKKWYSKTNFQAQRVEPTLPIIDGEGIYRITLDADAPEGGMVLLRLVFFDRYDAVVGEEIIRDGEKEFCCPIRTYSYQVHLISAGASIIRFMKFEIQEVVDESEEDTEKTE